MSEAMNFTVMFLIYLFCIEIGGAVRLSRVSFSNKVLLIIRLELIEVLVRFVLSNIPVRLRSAVRFSVPDKLRVSEILGVFPAPISERFSAAAVIFSPVSGGVIVKFSISCAD